MIYAIILTSALLAIDADGRHELDELPTRHTLRLPPASKRLNSDETCWIRSVEKSPWSEPERQLSLRQ